MSSVPGVPLDELAGRADPETVVEFVAALLRARGWTVTRRGDRRVAATADGRTVRFAVVHPSDGPVTAVPEVDRVVAVGGRPQGLDTGAATVIDATALRRQLAYAVDRDVARNLLETHFGWTPSEESGGERGDAGAAGGPGVPPSPPGRGNGAGGVGRWRVAALVLVVASLLAGGAVALSGVTDAPGDPGSDTPATSVGSAGSGTVGAAPPDDTLATGTATPETPAFEGTPTQLTDGLRAGREPEAAPEARYGEAPPGIAGPDRIYVHRLAGAFWKRLDNRSYRLSISYRELEDGHTRGSYTEILRVESNARYRVSTSRIGSLRADPLRIAGRELYANGSVRFERIEGSVVRRSPTTTYDPFMVNATQYVGWFFSARNSTLDGTRVKGNTTTYHLLTDGDPDPRFEDVRGSALVTEGGLVTTGRWSYTPADHPETRAVFEMRVTDVGSTRVTAPEWVQEE
jgi:hypothetical protein